MKLCVIGCGGMSARGHGPAFLKYSKENRDIFLSACCDLEESRAKNYSERFGFAKYYTDYRIMLKSEAPDAVSLICPVDKTKELAIDIIKRGFPLILEKPPGRNEAEIHEIITAAKENNVFVQTAFNRRYTPLIQQLREYTRDKGIYHINYNMIRSRRFDKDFSTTSIHGIDAVKFLAGADYKSIKFSYQDLPDFGETVSNIYLSCVFENNMVANLNFVVAGGGIVESVMINSLDETYMLNVPFFNAYDYPGKIIVLRSGEQAFEIRGDSTLPDFLHSGFYNENKSFLDCVKNGKKDYSDDLESGLQSVIIADLIRNRATDYVFLRGETD